MTSRASIAKHPIHPMLVAFPIGLWVFSLVCDVAYAIEWGGQLWKDMAFYTMAGGIVSALLAAVPGVIDWFALRDPRVRRIGLIHMVMNLAIVGAFALNLWLRASGVGGALPVALSGLSIVALMISGWLGGEMVYVHGVSVEPQHDTHDQARAKARVA